MYVTVTDVNDNPPKFTKDSYKLLYRNGNSDKLGSIEAKDPDLGDGGKVKYRMENQYQVFSHAYYRDSPQLFFTVHLFTDLDKYNKYEHEKICEHTIFFLAPPVQMFRFRILRREYKGQTSKCGKHNPKRKKKGRTIYITHYH